MFNSALLELFIYVVHFCRFLTPFYVPQGQRLFSKEKNQEKIK